MSEYMFYDHPEHGAAEGRAYLNDIAFVLKPFIDGLLRTRKENHFTCIAGSSMGGLISFYAGLYLPEVFGAVGVLSPALWLDAPRIFNETQSLLLTDSRRNDPGLRQRWYFYAGALETETLISEVATMVMIMRQSPHIEVTYQLDSGGIHDEIVWNHYFPNLYKWFTGLKPAEVVEGESHIRIP